MFMLEKALVGSRRYWLWVAMLSATAALGAGAWIHEQQVGLGMTGLTRDVPWGLYIGQFVFFVGLGASALVVVLPFYLHDWKAFAGIAVLGEILGMVSVFMAMLFIFVSMGQPMRILNVLLYPHPKSLIFWDLLVLSGYVLLNATLTFTLVSSESEGVPPPGWSKPLVLLSLPWAVSIHIVTAFLLCGLVARPYWMTPLLAPRFLASAFSSGSALLILLILIMKRFTGLEPGREAVRRLSVVAAYCLTMHVFLDIAETFTTVYGNLPEPMSHVQYLFAGSGGNSTYTLWMWLSKLLAIAALAIFLVPAWRTNHRILPVACGAAFVSIWFDKGLGLMIGGFVPNVFGSAPVYIPDWPEWTMVAGIWAFGALLITVFFKITLAVRETSGAKARA